MSYLEKETQLSLCETVLHGKTFEDIQLILENEREFMYPEDLHGEMSLEEKFELRKNLLVKIARTELMESVKCAMADIAAHAEEIIKLTAPKEKVVDGEVKTLQGWMDSEVSNFADYVKEGDKVSRDIVDYFINCIPPRNLTGGFFQMGTPQDMVREGSTYMTFIYLYDDDSYSGEVWQYKGNCLGGSCVKGTEISICNLESKNQEDNVVELNGILWKEYNGFHFSPETGCVSLARKSVDYISSHLRRETTLKLNEERGVWNYYAFYAAVEPERKHDLFRCKETGKLYIPAEHELFEWNL